jgi:hypothetical protein
MIMPVGAESLAEAVQIGAEVFHALKKNLAKAGQSTSVGDEGGFAPGLSSATEALDFIMKSIGAAGYKPGKDVYLALDCAATEYFSDGIYDMKGEGRRRDAAENADYLAGLVDDYPIISVEDGMSEDDWEGWKILTEKLGDRCQLVGDDLFVTNTARSSASRRRSSAGSRPSATSSSTSTRTRTTRSTACCSCSPRSTGMCSPSEIPTSAWSQARSSRWPTGAYGRSRRSPRATTSCRASGAVASRRRGSSACTVHGGGAGSRSPPHRGGHWFRPRSTCISRASSPDLRRSSI